MTVENQYTGVDTKNGLEGMRSKVSMYLGSTGVLREGHSPKALIQMAQEVVSNSADEALAGYGSKVTITVNEDNSMIVEDEGRGIPKGPDDSFDDVIRSATAPHTSGKFENANYAGQHTTGTHGIGFKAVNAISEKLIIHAISHSTRLKRDGQKVLDGGLVEYVIEFEQEKILRKEILHKWSKKDLDEMSDEDRVHSFTKVQFWPDTEILESIEWVNDDLYPRFNATAFLFPGVEVTYHDLRHNISKVWKYENGLADYLQKIASAEVILSTMKEPIVIDKIEEVDKFAFKISAALTFTEDPNSILQTYANGVPTREGGPHLDGFEEGFLKAINEYAIKQKLTKTPYRLSDAKEGLICALHVQVPAAIVEFDGQTKEQLATVQAKPATKQAIQQSLSDWLYDHQEAAVQIIENIERSRQAREAASKARKETKSAKDSSRKNKLRRSAKVKAATSKDKSKRELIVTEGDSASNFKRNDWQAIFGIRGKILNVFEMNWSEAMKNEEVSAIFSELGCGVGRECDTSKMNYARLVLAADADDDGAHINTLLIGMTYRFGRKLIEEGRLYIVVPPLYKAEKYVKGKPHIKMYFDEQSIKKDRGNLAGYSIQRYKGLGEMMPQTEGYDAIANPETRRLIQVTIEDALEAAQSLKTLLGNDSSLRKQWIEDTIDFDEYAYR